MTTCFYLISLNILNYCNKIIEKVGKKKPFNILTDIRKSTAHRDDGY